MTRQTRTFVPIRTLAGYVYFSDGHGLPFLTRYEKKHKDKVGIGGVEVMIEGSWCPQG
jgi:hypothetical protein